MWRFEIYAADAGVPGIAPHDLRRTCAKLCRAAGGELEQIQAAARPRFGSDDRALTGHRAGSSPRAERRDTVEAGRIAERVL
jgi:hypothetical protein